MSIAENKKQGISSIWIGRMISSTGTALSSLAASILVYQLENTASSVGLMLIVIVGSVLLTGMVGKKFVDRSDGKWVLIAAGLLQAALVFLLPILALMSIARLYLFMLLISVMGKLCNLASERLLLETEVGKKASETSPLTTIVTFSSVAIGFAVAGVIAQAQDIPWAFYLSAGLFLCQVVCILFFRQPAIPVGSNARTANPVQKQSRRLLFESPVLRSLTFASIPAWIGFGLIYTLLLPFAMRALKASIFEYGLLEGLAALGFLAGSLLLAALIKQMRESAWMAIGLILAAILGIAVSFLSTPLLAIIGLSAGFFEYALSAAGRQQLIQPNTPSEMRKNVNDIFSSTQAFCFLVGMAAAGLADWVDVRSMFLIGSLLLLGSGIWALFLPSSRPAVVDWKRAHELLRTATSSQIFGVSRPAMLADLDTLVSLMPSLAGLSQPDRQSLIGQARLIEAASGATIIQHGETGESGFFIISGKAVAGVATGEGSYNAFSSLKAGDYFGEIDSLSKAAQKADVVIEENASLLQVPADVLRDFIDKPAISRLMLAGQSEPKKSISIDELPRFAGQTVNW